MLRDSLSFVCLDNKCWELQEGTMIGPDVLLTGSIKGNECNKQIWWITYTLIGRFILKSFIQHHNLLIYLFFTLSPFWGISLSLSSVSLIWCVCLTGYVRNTLFRSWQSKSLNILQAHFLHLTHFSATLRWFKTKHSLRAVDILDSACVCALSVCVWTIRGHDKC